MAMPHFGLGLGESIRNDSTEVFAQLAIPRIEAAVIGTNIFRDVHLFSVLSARYACGMSEKVSGPASYFPSIEKKYGKPIDYWMTQLDSVRDSTHMVQVAYLKDNFEMGHGHANAIVHVYRQKNGL